MSLVLEKIISLTVFLISSIFVAIVSFVYLKNMGVIKLEHGIDQSILLRSLTIADLALAIFILLSAVIVIFLSLFGFNI